MATETMIIERIILREIQLPLVQFFETSFGATRDRQVLLVEACTGEAAGWGECVAGEKPFYSYETTDTAWLLMSRWIAPALIGQELAHPGAFGPRVAAVRGHNMAKAAVEAALWDLWAQRQGVPLWRALGGERERIECGVSIGIQKDHATLLQKIERELEAGYRKIKIKIKPGWDVEVVREVRRHFPEISLMVDANSAYRLEDLEVFEQLDEFDLSMIEQPLAHDDIVDHARLQARIKTPLCLDESIRHARDAEHACRIEACRVINIKMGRVGGPAEAVRVHDACRRHGVPVWCGGMLETGVGRVHNIALSTLANFSLPGDVSASQRYFERDTIRPPVEVAPDGTIEAPSGTGLGYEVDREWIDQITVRRCQIPSD